MELDFRGCTTKEDVEAVFEDKKLSLQEEVENMEKLRILFFEEDVDKLEGKTD